MHVKGLFFQDSKPARVDLIIEETRRLAAMFEGLDSNYRAQIPSSKYGVLLRAIANELAQLILSGKKIGDDRDLDLLRGEVAYQVLGHRLLTVDPIFFPVVRSDTEFRKFLKALLLVILRGSTLPALDAGAATLTGPIDTETEELIAFVNNRDIVSAYDISDQHMWHFILDMDAILESGVPFDETFNLSILLQGLEFIGKLLKPAHTLFFPRFLLHEQVPLVREERGALLFENYFTEEVGTDCDINKTGICVREPLLEIIAVPTNVLRTRKVPITDERGRCCTDPTASQVKVFADNAPVDVLGIEPFLGIIMVGRDILPGEQVVLEYCTCCRPTYCLCTDFIPATTDAFGDVPEAWVTDCDETELVEDVDAVVVDALGHVLLLGDPESLIGDEEALFQGEIIEGPSIQTVDATIFCHTSAREQRKIKYNYSGFELANTSPMDDLFRFLTDTVTPVRNTTDDAHWFDSRGPAVEGVGPPDFHFTSLASTQILREGSPLVPWTQDCINALNRVFSFPLHPYIPSVTAFLNDLNRRLNDPSLEIGEGEITEIRNYLQDLYSTVIEFTTREGVPSDLISEAATPVCCEKLEIIMRFTEEVPPPLDNDCLHCLLTDTDLDSDDDNGCVLSDTDCIPGPTFMVCPPRIDECRIDCCRIAGPPCDPRVDAARIDCSRIEEP